MESNSWRISMINRNPFFSTPFDVAAILLCEFQAYFTELILCDLIGSSSINALSTHHVQHFYFAYMLPLMISWKKDARGIDWPKKVCRKSYKFLLKTKQKLLIKIHNNVIGFKTLLEQKVGLNFFVLVLAEFFFFLKNHYLDKKCNCTYKKDRKKLL